MADELTDVITQSDNVLAEFEQSLKGTGEQSHAAFRSLRQATMALPSVGTAAATSIARVKQGQDASLPPEGVTLEAHRAAQIQQLTGDAHTIIEKLRQASYSAADALENTLHDAILPTPSKESGERMLRRDELSRVLAGAKGQAMIGKMVDTIGANPSWDAELLSDHGRALLASEGMSNEWGNFKRAAVGKLMQQAGGTERQVAAKSALAAFHRSNVRGRITAYHQAARMRLG